MPGDRALSREALIEAAAAELPTFVGPGGALDWEKRETAEAVLSVILPLIADAIEADREQPEHRHPFPSCERSTADAARLVRSLGGGQPND